jgi:S1-C subfamily serine protease
MKRRKFLKLSSVGLLATSCTPILKHYLEKIEDENNEILYKNLQIALDSLVEFDVRIKYKEAEAENPVEKSWKGHGVVYGDYVLTLDHVTNLHQIVIHTSYGTFIEEVQQVEKRLDLDGHNLEEVVSNKSEDFAVLKLPQSYPGLRYPFGLGDSDKLEIGQEIYVVGHPKDGDKLGKNVRDGIVSSKVVDGLKGADGIKTPGFYISANKFISGDSGTITLDAHDFKILGLNAESHYGFPFVRPINLLKQYLQK